MKLIFYSVRRKGLCLRALVVIKYNMFYGLQNVYRVQVKSSYAVQMMLDQM